MISLMPTLNWFWLLHVRLSLQLQCFLYTILTVAWPLIIVESLHGFSFALPMAAMCTDAAVLSPDGMTATVIGLTQGMYWGLGEYNNEVNI